MQMRHSGHRKWTRWKQISDKDLISTNKVKKKISQKQNGSKMPPFFKTPLEQSFPLMIVQPHPAPSRHAGRLEHHTYSGI
jgi:hypothetical protein